jgi:hypothetical protein
LATGQKVRKRTVETRDELTAHERQIARQARDRLSNGRSCASGPRPSIECGDRRAAVSEPSHDRMVPTQRCSQSSRSTHDES